MRSPIPVLLLGALLAAPIQAEDLDERVPAPPGGRLEFDLDRGDGLRPDPGTVEVTTHDADEVRILVDRSGWAASSVHFRIDRSGDTVRIFGRPRGAFSWLFGGPQVNVRVWVPREFAVDIRCSAGTVRIDGITGSVRAKTRDAAIEVSATEGPVRLRVVNGSIRISEATGALDLKTSDGDIELAWITGDVEARTADGEIEASHIKGHLTLRSDAGSIEVREIDGRLDAKTERGAIFASFATAPAGALETRRGEVEVALPRDEATSLDALTRRGEVEIADGIQIASRQGDGRVIGDINGGGATLRLYTARGQIRVRPR